MEYVAPAHRYIVELPESPPTNAWHMEKGIYGSISSVVSIQTLFVDSDEPPTTEYIAPVDCFATPFMPDSQVPSALNVDFYKGVYVFILWLHPSESDSQTTTSLRLQTLFLQCRVVWLLTRSILQLVHVPKKVCSFHNLLLQCINLAYRR
jgi:hypothetical protein